MRAMSSAASISIHAAVAAAFLLGTTKPARTSPVPVETVKIMFPRPAAPGAESGADAIGPVPSLEVLPDVGSIPRQSMLQTEALIRPLFPTDWAPRPGVSEGQAGGWTPALIEAAPEVLAGPLPLYPDLLRQAGLEGQVVLEARVDTTGRVQRGSITVVSATHPGFVASARQALMATLFRPARVNGRAVPMLVRVPFAFSMRGGTGHAR